MEQQRSSIYDVEYCFEYKYECVCVCVCRNMIHEVNLVVLLVTSLPSPSPPGKHCTAVQPVSDVQILGYP